jgi:hypothetical protein
MSGRNNFHIRDEQTKYSGHALVGDVPLTTAQVEINDDSRCSHALIYTATPWHLAIVSTPLITAMRSLTVCQRSL